MSNTTFRIFNPRAPKEDRVQKRRAQLRQAQHNYRERKEKYVKDLEEDVSSSRAREARLMRQNERLTNAVQALTRLLQQRGGSVPPEIVDLVQEQPNDKPLPASPSVMSEATTAVSSSFSPPVSTPQPAADVDLDGLGVEFVLALERPCWRHLHGDPDKPEDPSGHTLTASSQVCAIASPPSCALPPASADSIDQQQIPAAMLENLLKLSQMLNDSDREVTPVQAWHYLRSQYQFGTTELQSLLSLAQSCTDAVKCHGFGAVIDQNKFKKLASSVLQQKHEDSNPPTTEEMEHL